MVKKAIWHCGQVTQLIYQFVLSIPPGWCGRISLFSWIWRRKKTNNVTSNDDGSELSDSNMIVKKNDIINAENILKMDSEGDKKF